MALACCGKSRRAAAVSRAQIHSLRASLGAAPEILQKRVVGVCQTLDGALYLWVGVSARIRE